METLLKKLVDANAISGFEDNIREVIKKEISGHVNGFRVDKVGNLIARKGSGKPIIMLVGHMDVLGLMVKYIDDKGFIRFEMVGGWDERVLPGQKVRIHGSKGSLVGVIGSKAIHLQDRKEEKLPYKAKDLFIDVGASDRKEVEKAGVGVGDYITRYSEFNKLLGSKVTAAGFDNRVGCSVLIEATKQLKKFKGTLYTVWTVQEETGLVGVRGSVFGVNPDVVLAVDVGLPGDSPETKPEESDVKLGKGPVLTLKDALSFINPEVKKWVLDAAKKLKMDMQYSVMSGGAAEGSMPAIIREGIPAGSLEVPNRYMHTPVEVVDINDMKQTVKLVVECVKTADNYF